MELSYLQEAAFLGPGGFADRVSETPRRPADGREWAGEQADWTGAPSGATSAGLLELLGGLSGSTGAVTVREAISHSRRENLVRSYLASLTALQELRERVALQQQIATAMEPKTIADFLSTGGRPAVATRIQQLLGYAEEDPDEPKIELESLRHMALFVLRCDWLPTPTVGVGGEGLLTAEWRILPSGGLLLRFGQTRQIHYAGVANVRGSREIRIRPWHFPQPKGAEDCSSLCGGFGRSVSQVGLPSVEPIPDTDHVARHCQPGDMDGDKRFPIARAFHRKADEPSVSVNWLEYLKGSHLEHCLQLFRPVLNKKRTVRRSHRLVVVRVAEARDALRKAAESESRVAGVEIRHDPETDDRSHAGIFGCEVEDDTVALILKELVQEHDVQPAFYTASAA